MNHGSAGYWVILGCVCAVLIFAYSLFTVLAATPWLLGFTLALILGGPVIGFFLGHAHASHAWRDMVETFGVSMPETGKARVIQARSRPLQIYYGDRAREHRDYKAMVREWLRVGWPNFDRDYLRRNGARVGANDNYTAITECLLANNVIQEAIGHLPDEDERTVPHRLYEWTADSQEIANWIEAFDWATLEKEGA